MPLIFLLICFINLCYVAIMDEEIMSYYAQSGSDHNLTCNGTIDINSFNLIKWYKNRKPIAYLTNQTININSKYQQRSLRLQGKDLMIYNITKNDSGFYKCIIDQDNKVSISNIQLMVVDVPSSPSRPIVLSVAPRSVNISWTSPDPFSQTAGPNAQTYLVEFKEGKLSEKWVIPGDISATNATVTTVGTGATLTGLKPYTRYSFRVTAANGLGKSEPGPVSAPVVTALERPSDTVLDFHVGNVTEDSITLSWRPPMPLSLNGPLLGYRLNVTPVNQNAATTGRFTALGTRPWDGSTNAIPKHPSSPVRQFFHVNHPPFTNVIYGPYPSSHILGRPAATTTIKVRDLTAFGTYRFSVEPFNGMFYGPATGSPGPVCTAQARPAASLPPGTGLNLLGPNSTSDGTGISLEWEPLTDARALKGSLGGYKFLVRPSPGSAEGPNGHGWSGILIARVPGSGFNETSGYRLRSDPGKPGIFSVLIPSSHGIGRDWDNCSYPWSLRDSAPWYLRVTNLSSLTNYSFSLSAYNGAGDGPETGPLYHSTDVRAPGAPVNLTVRHLSHSSSPGDQKSVSASPPLLISWGPPPDTPYHPHVARYRVELYEAHRPRTRRLDPTLVRPVNTFIVVPNRNASPLSPDADLHVLISGIRTGTNYDIRVAAEIPSRLEPNKTLVGPYTSIHHSYMTDGRDYLKHVGYPVLTPITEPAAKFGLEPGDIAKMGLIAGISVSAIFFVMGVVMLFTWKRYYTRQKYSFLPYIMSTPPSNQPTRSQPNPSAVEAQQPTKTDHARTKGSAYPGAGCTLVPSPHGLSKISETRRSQKCRQKCRSSRRHKSVPADCSFKGGSHTRSPSLVSPLLSYIRSSVGRHFGRVRRHGDAKGPLDFRVRKGRPRSHLRHQASAQPTYQYLALSDKSNKNRRSDWLAMIENSEYDHVTPIGLADWALYNEVMHAHSDQGFSDQFAHICRNSASLLLPENNVASNLATNRRKNRYANIFAYDPTRVLITSLSAPQPKQPAGGDHNLGDYINANFIKGYNNPRAYIATQGPLVSSVDDFWTMIWDYGIETVVMITNLVERGKVKCDLYWPADVGSAERYGNSNVRHLSTEKRAYYTIRTFAVSPESAPTRSWPTTPERRLVGDRDAETNVAPKAFFARPDPRDSFVGCTISDTFSPSGQPLPLDPSLGARIVVQYHYTQWPDHGVPRFALPLLSFIRRCGHSSHSHQEKTGGTDNQTKVSTIESIKGDRGAQGCSGVASNHDMAHHNLTMCSAGGTSIPPCTPSEGEEMGSAGGEVSGHAKDSLPLVVHCSAGVGRTGTYFVIDVMLQRVVNEATFDVYNYLSEIRQQRNYLVQTEEQFIFIHDALSMALAIGDSTLLSPSSLESMLDVLFNSQRTGQANLAAPAANVHPRDFKSALQVRNDLYAPRPDWSASAEALLKGPVRHAKAKVLKLLAGAKDSRPKSAAGLYYAPPPNLPTTLPLVHTTTSLDSRSGGRTNMVATTALDTQAKHILLSHYSPSSSFGNGLKLCNRHKNRCTITSDTAGPPSHASYATALNNNPAADLPKTEPAKAHKTTTAFELPTRHPVLPHDDWRVTLTPKPTLEGSDYINATYLEGFYSQKDFIITQHPTLATVHNFWQMVWENNCTEIFLLIFPKDSDSEAFLPFWPALESYLSFDSIKVYCLDSKSRNNLDAQSDGLFSLINFSLESDDEDYQLLTKMYICNGDLLPRCLASPTSLATAQDFYRQIRSWHKPCSLGCRNLTKFVSALINVLMRKNKPPLNALSQNLSPIVIIDKFGGFEAAALCILASAYLEYLHDGSHFDLFQMAYIYNTKRLNLFTTKSDVVALYTAMAGLITSKMTPTPCDSFNFSILPPQMTDKSFAITASPTYDSFHDDLNKTDLSFNTINEYVPKLGEKISC